MKIFGVSLVRSASDIIALTIRYHLQLGWDGIFVLDNASSDGTDKILEQMARADDRIRWSRHEGQYQQAELTTGLAREAFRAGADWIVPFDADEFWYAPTRPIREVLADSKAGALRAQVINYIQAREQTMPSAEALLTVTRRAPRTMGPPDHGRALVEAQEIGYVEAMYPPKLLSRAAADLWITAGNHHSENLPGKPETTLEIVCLHAPLYSRDKLVLKGEHSRRLEEAGQPATDGWHTHRVRRLLEEDSIEAEWAANSYQNDALDVYGVRRPVIFDSTLRDAVAPFLKDAPVLQPATPADRTAWQTARAQNFLTDLHDDALLRTAWAKTLDEDLIRARQVISDLEETVTERTAWAQAADTETARARRSVRALQSELASRAASEAVDH